jgi:hypothetical protein
MHHYGGKKPKAGEDAGDVGEEIADAVFVLVCLANSLNVDLDEKFGAIMRKYREREGRGQKLGNRGRAVVFCPLPSALCPLHHRLHIAYASRNVGFSTSARFTSK